MALNDYLVPIVSGRYNTNICIDCKKACGGCSWTEWDAEKRGVRFEPVEGWTAEEVDLLSYIFRGKRYTTKTYHVMACPLFERDDERMSDQRELSPEQSKYFLENIRKVLRRWANEEYEAFKHGGR